jgi:hypothetical protein
MTEQKVLNIACAIKEYLIDLAVNDKLPMDMTELDEMAIFDTIKKNLPTAEDEAIAEAEHYLSDSVLSTKEQIEAIAKQAEKDGSVMIDDVEGVVVWEPLERRFDCDTFLLAIGWDLI